MPISLSTTLEEEDKVVDIDIENPITPKNKEDDGSNNPAKLSTTHLQDDTQTTKATIDFGNSFRWKVLGCYLLPFLKAVAFEFRQVTLVALIEKMLRLAIESSLSAELYQQVMDSLYASILDSPTLRALILYDLTFAQTLLITISLVAVISLTRPLEAAISEYSLNRHEVKRLQSIVFDRLFFASSESTNLAIDITQANDLIYNNIPSIEKYWTDVKFKRIDELTTILTAATLIMVTAWDLGLIVIAGSLSVFVMAAFASKKLLTPWAGQLDALLKQTTARLSDMLSCRDVILTHSMEVTEQQSLHNMFQQDSKQLTRLFRGRIISFVVMLGGLTMILPMVFLVVFLGEITLARVFQILLIENFYYEIVNSFSKMLDSGHIVEQYSRSIQNMCAVLQIPQEELFPSIFTSWEHEGDSTNDCVDEKIEGSSLSSSISSSLVTSDSLKNTIMEAANNSADCKKELSMKHLEAGYTKMNGQTTTVINDLSLTLTLGKHYGVMGESGAGKSTLFKILCGLLHQNKGTVSIDGQTIDTTQQYWRDQVAVVSQDSILFNRSLRENLTYGLPHKVCDDTIWDALIKVNLEDRIYSLPAGLDTMIFENGNEFSGGQKQRMQIARLLLCDKPVVLLDEMTSALDYDSTQKVVEVLREFCQNKTLFLITHDSDTLALVDTVFDLKRGGHVEVRQSKRMSNLAFSMSMRGNFGGKEPI